MEPLNKQDHQEKGFEVLFIVDSSENLQTIQRSLAENHEISFLRFQNLKLALNYCNQANVDIIFLDPFIKGTNGYETFDQVSSRNSEIPIVIYTDLKKRRVAQQLIRRGAQDYILKGNIRTSELTKTLYCSIERKKMYTHLNAKNLELEECNRALETFAKTAAHDLQEPLRKVKSFTNSMIQKMNPTEIPSDARNFLMRTQNATHRMETLIEDLLEYSQISKKGVAFKPVNLQSIVTDVISHIDPELRALNGKINVGLLPTIDADESYMRQFFHNLISNGIKFRKKDEPPHISVCGEIISRTEIQHFQHQKERLTCKITVEDQGIGFDEKYEDLIFKAFQRLHSRDEYEGAGIGLAMCRRIVDIHSGQIYASSEIDRGTQFLAFLPVHQIGEERT